MPAEAKEAVGLNTDTGIKQCRISSSSLCWEQVKPIENLCFIDNPCKFLFYPQAMKRVGVEYAKTGKKYLQKTLR